MVAVPAAEQLAGVVLTVGVTGVGSIPAILNEVLEADVQLLFFAVTI
jgi:hypothetical protein